VWPLIVSREPTGACIAVVLVGILNGSVLAKEGLIDCRFNDMLFLAAGSQIYTPEEQGYFE